MLFCRCREGVRVELALRLAPGIHGYGPYDVKIGLILPRLFISDRDLRSGTTRWDCRFYRFRSGPQFAHFWKPRRRRLPTPKSEFFETTILGNYNIILVFFIDCIEPELAIVSELSFRVSYFHHSLCDFILTLSYISMYQKS